MFKKLIPVVALALIAGPVFAADSPPAGADQSTSTASSGKASHKHKHHKSHKSTKTSGSSSSTDSAPAK
jgi:hypothetical protein